MRKKCQHEHKAKRSGEWIPCREDAYNLYGSDLPLWLCRGHYKEKQAKWISGRFSGYRAYFYSEVIVVRKNDKKWEVYLQDKVVILKTRNRAMAYGLKMNKQLTNPVGLKVLQLRTV